MNIMEYISARGSEVDREIERVIPRNKEPQAVYGVIWDLLARGGKRFRPVICMLSCEAVGGDSKKTAANCRCHRDVPQLHSFS